MLYSDMRGPEREVIGRSGDVGSSVDVPERDGVAADPACRYSVTGGVGNGLLAAGRIALVDLDAPLVLADDQ